MSLGHLQVLRRSLWPLSPVYGLVMSVRNRLYDRDWIAVHRLEVPVVSVGNLTVGGTGKTPVVAWLVARAQGCGVRPGVLARGYGRQPGAELNDEGLMLRGRFPDLLQVQDPDRVRGGRQLVERGAELVIIDDGFQHRRLHRDRDVLCVDARRPFGSGGLLPAGDLREPRSGLRRATHVFLTRADGVSSEGLAARVDGLRRAAGRPLPVFPARHRPADLVRRPGGQAVPAAALGGRRVVLLSGVACPEAFAETVGNLGAEVVAQQRHPDHHRFSPAELRRAARLARDREAELLVTEKDDARLLSQAATDPAAAELERSVLRVDIEILGPEPDPDPATVL